MSSAPVIDIEARQMLRETAERFFADSASTLAAVGELGLLGLLTREEAGGGGWLPLEACIVAEEAGRALSPIAAIGNLVAAAAAATTPAAGSQLDDVLSGEVAGGIARAGRLSFDERTGAVTGTAVMIGDHTVGVLVAVDRERGAVVIDTAGRGVELTEHATLDTTRPTTVVTLDGARATPLDAPDARRIIDVATLLTSADALGALRRTVALVRDHLVDRTAFERPIASFQVIQHRLTDLEVLQAAIGSLIENAALALSNGDSNASRLVSATHTYVAAHVPPALDDCIQLSGGIGFTWEWPVHHALRRATVDATMPLNPAARTGDLITGGDPEPALAGDPHREFRARAREVIRKHAPYVAREGHRAPVDGRQEETMRAWYRSLYEHRLLGAAWPVERGGDPDHHPIHELIVTEELIRARAPSPIDQVQLASHVLLKFGTDEQKDHYLPRIREARDIWCQLFSEPDAGSDLAGIKARATRQDDGSWLLSGQKTWTTDGHWAELGLALLRTSTGGGRHAGITAFVVPMDAPGLIVQPMVTIGGAQEFNDVFLDGVVLDPDSVIGPIDDGWRVAMSGLEIERFGVGGNVLQLDLLLDDLAALIGAVHDVGPPGVSRDEAHHRMAGLAAEAEAAKAFVAGHVQRSLVGGDQPADASIAKILYTETYNRIAAYGAELATAHAPLPTIAVEPARRLTDAWLWSRAMTISGGSSEIMRNIIAKRRLGLPSG